jgi:RNA ligase
VTTLASIMDIPLLNQMIDGGYIRKQVHPDDHELVVLNYTEKAAFGRVWNEATLQCRGLIVRRHESSEAMVVARPFPKFFNHGENGRDDYNLFAPVEVTDKRDGSEGILHYGPDGPAIATRGSFASDQALHATKVYQDRYEGTWHPRAEETYVFEIVYPANRIVLDYGDLDDIILIGSVRVHTGELKSPKDIVRDDGWKGPIVEVFPQVTLFDALKRPPREGAEGLVIRYLKTREMVKIKQADYVSLHRIIFGLNERAVWQSVFDGKSADDINEGLPEEFQPWVEKVSARLWDEYYAIEFKAVEEYNDIRKVLNTAVPIRNEKARKKLFASHAVKSDTRGLLFSLYDGKSTREAIFKMIRPGDVTYSKEAAA